MKIYVGCALTQASAEFRQHVDGLKDQLRYLGHEVLDFVGLEAGTPEDVYAGDIRCVRECDIFIAVCDYPAIGLGYELGVAVEVLGKPVLAVAHKNAVVTRLVLGITHPNFTFRRYQLLADVKYFLAEMLVRPQQQQLPFPLIL